LEQKLNIRSKSFLGTHHSWAVTMRHLLTQFQNKGHKLYLTSTNGKDLMPESLLARLDRDLATPDIDICYTLPRNFKERFKPKSKLKLAIYNYESTILPKMWLSDIRYVDYVLPSSNFSKEVFVNSGWPEEKCIIVPHGIVRTSPEAWDAVKPYEFKNKKTFRFLNVSIPHYRKNIDLLVDCYYKTFSGEDDVCLVLKTSLAKPKQRFEVDVAQVIRDAQAKHKDRPGGLPHIEIIQNRVEDMNSLYKACDVVVSATSSEGFGLPLLEALDVGKLVIAPRCTGQLDFLNDNNSLLVDVKEIDAGSKYQYWIESPGAKIYLPIADYLSQAMLMAYRNHAVISHKFRPEAERVCQEFTWEKAADKILSLK
jgi:glycosyltransferase involved in cell wall biosynthesis